MSISESIPLPDKSEDYYSRAGLEIFALLRFIKQVTKNKVTQRHLVAQSQVWAEDMVIPKSKYPPLVNSEELSRAQRMQIAGKRKISNKRVAEIHALLLQMCQLYGYLVTEIKTDKKYSVTVLYEEATPYAETIERLQPQKENLARYGLVDVISGQPIMDEEFQKTILKATEIKILQSAFYKNRLIVEALSKAIEKGKLRKIKILLAQPFSQAAKDRSHTYDLKSKEQYAFFNSNVLEAISNIIGLREKPRKDISSKPTVKIELCLYARSPVFPMYQCLDEKGKNLLLLVGYFWHNHSSFDRPHFKIKGSSGALLDSIQDHFKEIWDDRAKSVEKVNWQSFLKRRTIKMDLEYASVYETRDFLKKAEELSMFFPQGPVHQSQWIYYKCFYYNFKNRERDFLLRIDTGNNIASITETHNNSTYLGVVVKLHNSYSLFLHSTNLGRNNRIITLSIPVGGTKLKDNSHCFAIYSNNDIDSGSPYSQMMLLKNFTVSTKIANDKDLFKGLYREVKVARDEYSPYLKEKKIHLPSSLWYKSDLRVDHIPDNYHQYFESRDRDKYFSLLQRELKTAKSEIYFLGYAPENSASKSNAQTIKKYYDLHLDLIKNHNIKISRILLDKNSVNGDFEIYLGNMFSLDNSEENFRFYSAKHRIPIINDTILIDPENPDGHKTAILSFMQERKGGAGSIPNRLEVIKRNPTIVENLHDTCLEFIDMEWEIKRYYSLEEFLTDKV